jgi:hypothetical protein
MLHGIRAATSKDDAMLVDGIAGSISHMSDGMEGI